MIEIERNIYVYESYDIRTDLRYITSTKENCIKIRSVVLKI